VIVLVSNPKSVNIVLQAWLNYFQFEFWIMTSLGFLKTIFIQNSIRESLFASALYRFLNFLGSNQLQTKNKEGTDESVRYFGVF